MCALAYTDECMQCMYLHNSKPESVACHGHDNYGDMVVRRIFRMSDAPLALLRCKCKDTFDSLFCVVKSVATPIFSGCWYAAAVM
ncbi:hypothetical protein BDV32DRAFT_81833 [Aspergillus pseudonomiae]|nr:hypothetical protein BDV32DRAFT_81833 [Aspergillus pseudonomiae]